MQLPRACSSALTWVQSGFIWRVGPRSDVQPDRTTPNSNAAAVTTAEVRAAVRYGMEWAMRIEQNLARRRSGLREAYSADPG